MRTMAAALRVPEVASRLNLSVREVYGLVDAGTLPLDRDDNGLVVVSEDAVAAYQQQTA